MAGIKEISDVLKFIIPFANAIDEATVDGFQWTDVVKIAPTLVKLPAAIQDINKVSEELEDLDADERKELIELIETMDFKSDSSEKILEQALIVAYELGRFLIVLDESKISLT